MTFDKKFVCATSYVPANSDIPRVSKDLRALSENFNKPYYVNDKGIQGDLRDEYMLVTYNGDYNYYGGFDYKYLRTKFALKELEWCFNGWSHLDVYPLFKKYFNHSFEEIKPPSKSNLYAADLKKLAKLNEIKYTNANDTYDSLCVLENIDWGEHDLRISNKDKFDEQSLYMTFFDPKGEEEYIDGSEVPELYEQGRVDEIIQHNINDVKRLHKLTDLLLDYLPKYEIDRAINAL